MIRRTCSLVAVVALLLQGSSGGHMLLVEHVRCAEHGELVHAGGAHTHEASDHATHDVDAWDRAPTQDDDGHGHCTHEGERRSATAIVAQAVIAALERELDAAPVPTVEEPTANVLRFRIAPKNSPPA